MTLHWLEKLVARALRSRGGPLTFEEIADLIDRDVGSVAKAASWLLNKGLIEVEERERKVFGLGEEGRLYVDRGLPERWLVDELEKSGGVLELNALREKLGEKEFKIAVAWGKRNEWISIEKLEGRVVVRLLKKPERELAEEKVLKILREGEKSLEEIPSELRSACLALASRPNVLEVKVERVHVARPTEKLMALDPSILEAKEVTRLTQGMIASGEWKRVKFSRFDIAAPTKPVFAARRHPLRELIKLVREIFAEMGFEEIRGPLVELAFWNFDALFQPQDHPAREMHDTFYLAGPELGDLPKRLVNSVKRVHENGGNTGSTGWRYRWSEEEARKLILRTHTTATTIRYLAEHREPPIKVFSVDRIYRNEAIDWKHLAEFHQKEGIVMGETVSFRDLLGLIKEFYARLGLKNVKFRPSYFPYTEPSAEAIAYLEDKKTWLELIGMGIFRPEVTMPLGIKHRVLAWGGGLERLALALYDLDDIRTFYNNNLNWIRGVPTTFLKRKTGRI
ncbi:MAG: phenylalanine--tRNA ligase subunit alpha [Thaumarchaeota archaeon]|nr:phenylalanine--tRNA ligase subunit alpha [Nitrososphaerota archaeon]